MKNNSIPYLDESRYLILKMIEQAIRDFYNLERSPAPIDQYHYETAKNFLFNDNYYIDYGDTVKTLNDLLDILSIEIKWFRERVRILKRKKNKEFEIKRMLSNGCKRRTTTTRTKKKPT